MHRYFSTPPIFSAPVNSIDRELGIVQGITIARVGPAKGHDGFIDRTFLLQIVDNAASRSAGIKARFGHPNMCSQALGTYLGRFKNYSYSGDLVKADLHLDETAKTTPSGDLYSYILDMAEKNPDMFGASIVFEIGESTFIEEEVDGEKVKKEYFRLKELRATDIVDEPAATDGLFSANTFPGVATQFLDENPEILELILSKPESIFEFLSNYLTHSNMTLSEKIRERITAFMAAIHPETTLPVPEVNEQQPSFINMLFSELIAEYPDAFSVTDESTEAQKADSIKAFFAAVKIQLQENEDHSRESEEADKIILSTQETFVSKMEAELEAATSRIAELTGQLSARPSIPLNVTDPQVGLGTGDHDKDETGKQILSQLPKDLKRKLKQT